MLAGVSLGLSIGLQTLKGGYPQMIASFMVLKNSTFSFLGFRAVYVTLQKRLVVFTALIKIPSKELSFSSEALYMISGVRCMESEGLFMNLEVEIDSFKSKSDDSQRRPINWQVFFTVEKFWFKYKKQLFTYFMLNCFSFKFV